MKQARPVQAPNGPSGSVWEGLSGHIAILLLALLGPMAFLVAMGDEARAQTCYQFFPQGNAGVVAYDSVPLLHSGSTARIRTVNTTPVQAIVRSTYVYLDTENFFEVGWSEGPSYGESEPTVFVAWSKNNVYGTRSYPDDPGPGGTYNQYRITNTGLETGGWKWVGRFNGAFLGYVKIPLMEQGLALGASERRNSCDSNWGHFKDLQRLNCYGCGWQPWFDLERFCDLDPDYGIHKISETNFYSEEGYNYGGQGCLG